MDETTKSEILGRWLARNDWKHNNRATTNRSIPIAFETKAALIHDGPPEPSDFGEGPQKAAPLLKSLPDGKPFLLLDDAIDREANHLLQLVGSPNDDRSEF